MKNKQSGFASAVILIILAGVVLVGGGVSSYLYYSQTPEQVVQKMMKEMSEAKSVEYTGEIVAEVDTSNLPDFPMVGMQQGELSDNRVDNFLIDFSGASDWHDFNSPKVVFDFSISTDIIEGSFGLKTRLVDNVNYLKLTSLPDLGFLDLSFLENQWIKIDPEVIKEQFGQDYQTEEAWNKKELSLEQIIQINEVVASASIFKVTEKLEGKKIEDVNTHHYKYVIDKEGLKQLFIKIAEIVKEPLDEDELQEMDREVQAMEAPAGEMWIGKKDFLLYKLLLNINIKETEKVKTEGEAVLRIQFKNYNEPVRVGIPSPVKTIEEIMTEFFASMFGAGLQNPEVNSQLPNGEMFGGSGGTWR